MQGSREVDEGARDRAVVASRREDRRPQALRAKVASFVGEGAALCGAGDGVDKGNDCLSEHAPVCFARDRKKQAQWSGSRRR